MPLRNKSGLNKVEAGPGPVSVTIDTLGWIGTVPGWWQYYSMPRKLHMKYPGAIFHAVNRGDRREDIFKDDPDRKAGRKRPGASCGRNSGGRAGEKRSWRGCANESRIRKNESRSIHSARRGIILGLGGPLWPPEATS